MARSGTMNLEPALRKWLAALDYVDIRVVAGARTRGRPLSNASIVNKHWTATPRRNAQGVLRTTVLPTLNAVTNGIDRRHDLGYFLQGPLYNVLCDHDFGQTKIAVALVAEGTANDAGAGSWRGVTGNSRTAAACVDTDGTLPWSDRMIEIMARVGCALMEALGETDIGRVCGHHEWTTRKIDPRPYMPRIRARMLELLATGPGGVTKEEEDMSLAVLKRDDNGPRKNEIVVLQWRLNTLLNGRADHPAGIPVDGKFGAWTETAVKALQRRYGYAESGVYDLALSERVMEEIYSRTFARK